LDLRAFNRQYMSEQCYCQVGLPMYFGRFMLVMAIASNWHNAYNSKRQTTENCERRQVTVSVVIYEKKDRIAFITINRPDAMNSLNMEVRLGLSEALQDFKADPEVWTAIITGAGGKAFSAGADLKEMGLRVAQTKSGELDPKLNPSRMVAINRGFEVFKPVIAAISGYCIGGGLEIAMACDIRIASPDSKLGLAEVTRAIIPGGGGTQRLPRLIPFGIAMKMLFTGELIDAETALRYGLINDVVPKDKVMDAAIALADKINSNGPMAVRYIKESAYHGIEMTLELGLAQEVLFSTLVRHTEDATEGPKAFAEKRKPVYKGR
ncbi:MAG: enoyl-CoA hydratase-related protein, partial [Dehalococcoidia bacterium]|nr:enoyl-CoA hydratase-related protein [Dehalococcoidia bacterium]